MCEILDSDSAPAAWARTILESNAERSFEIVINLSDGSRMKVIRELKRLGCAVDGGTQRGTYRITRCGEA